MAMVVLHPPETGFSEWFALLDSPFLQAATSSKIPLQSLLMVFVGSVSAWFLSQAVRSSPLMSCVHSFMQTLILLTESG